MTSAQAPRHSLLEDAQALATGTLFVALALVLFRQVGMITGGVTGLGLVIHYATGWPFGAVFFVLNLPFYLLAWRRMGWRFTLKTFLSVGLLALLTEALPHWLVLGPVNPIFAAVAGGLMAGAGFLILFRHESSLGGVNVLALWLQERRGWRAGKVQMGIDVAILLAAMPWVQPALLALSVLGALALNFALAVNHKPGRYVAV
jgi:uncharacterized membrane-anchored protein YitT (DUF2179 family)